MLRETWDRIGNLISSEPEEPLPVELYPLDFIGLFTPAELMAIEQSTSLSVVAARAQFFAAVNPIALNDPRFVAGVAAMEAAGILSADRAAAVLENRRPEGSLLN